jgi:hypothetical protein
MIAQFVEAPDVMQQTLTIPQVIYDQCAEQGVETYQHPRKSGDGKVQVDHGPMKLEFQKPWWNKIVNFFRSVLRF